MIDFYPKPYIDEQTWIDLRRAIETRGFEPDPFLQEKPVQAVFGLNIAFGWPLPTNLKEPYERLVKTLSELDSGLYVYPYNQTHVTVMTLVNFKEHKNPSQEESRTLRQTADEVASILTPLFSSDSPLQLKPFKIDVGPPVLSSTAAFLPILNPTQEIFRLREAASSILKRSFLPKILIPKAIHSTILRFIAPPTDIKTFVSTFESLVADFRLGEAIITEFLLTSETRPYMMGGEILYRFRLEV